MKNIIILLIVIFFSNTKLVLANSLSNIELDKSKPLTIVADKIKITRDKGEIIFIDNVKATQDAFTLYSDKMLVKYTETKNKKIDIKNIKAEDNVKFTNKEIVATGDIGFYDVKKNEIILKNNIKATEEGISVFAQEFKYNTITGKTNIIGGEDKDGRVVIILEDLEDL